MLLVKTEWKVSLSLRSGDRRINEYRLTLEIFGAAKFALTIAFPLYHAGNPACIQDTQHIHRTPIQNWV